MALQVFYLQGSSTKRNEILSNNYLVKGNHR